MAHSFVRGLLLSLIVSGLLTIGSIEVQAATIRVPADHPTIQQAINAAVNGDTVLVSPGTYLENINFLGKDITVMSEGGASVTIIDGTQSGSVVTFISGETRSAVLDGFTVRNGRGVGFSLQGGGIRIENSSPTITHNIITQNAGCQGMGMLISSGSPLIQYNTITNNTQQLCSGGAGGGGIFIIDNSTAQILDNIISNNFLNSLGGGMNIRGSSPIVRRNLITGNGGSGGCGISVTFSSSNPLIEGNIITFNQQFASSGGFGGGGIGVSDSAKAQIMNNVIANNSIDSGIGGGGITVFGGGETIIQSNIITDNTVGTTCCPDQQGGGIYVNGFAPQLIIQNLIIRNKVPGQGGGVWGTNIILVNNTIADNDASQGSGIFAQTFIMNQFFNNIIAAKPGQTAVVCTLFTSDAVNIFESNNVFSPGGMAYGGDCPDQTGMNGNISADPLFVDPANGDYHLQTDSPCVDAGNNLAPELPLTDFDGDSRILDGDDDGVEIVDMGIDEVLPPLPPFDVCIQDNSNGNTLRFNSTTGDYLFIKCGTDGFTLIGKGTIGNKRGVLNLTHFTTDRRVQAFLMVGQNKGTAAVQVPPSAFPITINDGDITNNSCTCPNN